MSILWIVDRDGRRLESAFRLLPNDSPTNLIVNIRQTTTLMELAAEVRRRVQHPVRLIRILSHGDSGQLFFSNGTVNANNVAALHFLRGLVLPSGLSGSAGIEVHGCGVASDFLPPPRREAGIGNVVIQNYGNMQGQLAGWGRTEDTIRGSRGIHFLLAMANVCGVGVKGGLDYQLPDAEWSYEGPAFTVSSSRQVRLEDPQNRLGLGQFFSFRI